MKAKSIKPEVIKVVTSLTKKINQEKDPDKRHRLQIVKQEFSKLADQL